MRGAIALVMLLVAPPAHAQLAVDVTLNTDGNALANQVGITPAEMRDQMQSLIDDAYAASNMRGFLRTFADATAFSMRGLGVDYASDPESIILGVGASFAIAASSDVKATERPAGGIGANIGFMAGYNLASEGAPRWTVLGNGFYREGSMTNLRGGILSAGLHVQYRLVNPQRDDRATTKILRWIGVDLTAGVELTRWNMGVENTITTEIMIDGSKRQGRIILDSTGRFDLSSRAVTLPVEVTTGVRIAMLVSTYVGIGFDPTLGTSKLDANLDGTVYSSTGTRIGTATITGGGDSRASPYAARVLAGVQLNLWKLRVYTQVNASITPAASLGFGVRGVL